MSHIQCHGHVPEDDTSGYIDWMGYHRKPSDFIRFDMGLPRLTVLISRLDVCTFPHRLPPRDAKNLRL